MIKRIFLITFSLLLLSNVSNTIARVNRHRTPLIIDHSHDNQFFKNKKVTPLDYPAYVITGGPGSGKTTLLDRLKKRGHSYVEEVARDLIKSETSIRGEALPTKNLALFNKLLLTISIHDYKRAIQTFRNNAQKRSKPIFFDRGIPDVMAYMSLDKGNRSLPIDYINAAINFPYNKTVFILPPWEKIYINDTERRETFEEAKVIFNALYNTYKTLGYNVVEVPIGEINMRVDFILSYLAAH